MEDIKVKYAYPDVTTFSFRATKKDMDIINALRDRIVTKKKKTYSFVLREALNFSMRNMDKWIVE